MALTIYSETTWTRGEHIIFRFIRSSESGKTKIFDVMTLDMSSKLGEVRWFGRWRKYSFFPAPDCVFEQTCLRDIAEFCERETRDQSKKVV